MTRKNKEIRDFERIIEDYAPSSDIFSEDEQLEHRCKKALSTLPPADRRLFILFAETGSIRELSRHLQISHSTLHYRIGRIRTEIRKRLNAMTDNRT